MAIVMRFFMSKFLIRIFFILLVHILSFSNLFFFTFAIN